MTEEQRTQYSNEGYAVCPDLLDRMQLDLLLAEIDQICGENTLAHHDKARIEMEPNQKPDGKLVRRIYQPCSYYAPFWQLSESPSMLDAVATLIGPDIIFHYSKINMKPPAIGSVVEWHQDLSYYPLTNDASVTLLIYLDDAAAENGCLQVVPAQHESGLLNHMRDGFFVGRIVESVDESTAVALEGKAGTAVFMHCLTPHSSVTNTSSRPRRTLILSYRAADAYPIYVGKTTDEMEEYTRLVRGRRRRCARFTFEQLPIPVQKKKTASLYELQELSRQEQPS
jgi:phytanoyl-CoA hydroxylase